MKKDKFYVCLRIFIALCAWFLIYKLFGVLVGPALEGTTSNLLRNVICRMVVPYTLGLGFFYIIVRNMEKKEIDKQGISATDMVKAFVIQSGFSFFIFFIINLILTICRLKKPGLATEDISSNIIFYIVLLLIFNPILEEFLYRKLVLERLLVVGEKLAIFLCAALFALPHLFSMGFPSMVYTFVLGVVWSVVTIRTGKLWPAIVLHALSNLYGSFLPLLMTQTPITSVMFVFWAVIVMPVLALILLINRGASHHNE